MDEKELRSILLKPLDRMMAEKASKNTAADAVTPPSGDPKEEMSLMKYVSNPTGKGSAYVANRSAIKQGLNAEYIKLLRNFRRYFYAIPYVYNNGDILYYVKVPSEFYKDNKISYDVLFLLKYNPLRSRSNRAMKMFVNSPSFLYTYCYVYNKADLLIDKFKLKYPHIALTTPPEVRNPIQSFGFEKISYIAARYLIDGGCLADGYVNRFGKPVGPYTENEILSKIADPDLLVQIYQTAQYNKRKTHRKPMPANEKKRRRDQLKDYAKEQARNRPKGTGLFHKSPRASLSARKARRSILNGK